MSCPSASQWLVLLFKVDLTLIRETTCTHETMFPWIIVNQSCQLDPWDSLQLMCLEFPLWFHLFWQWLKQLHKLHLEITFTCAWMAADENFSFSNDTLPEFDNVLCIYLCFPYDLFSDFACCCDGVFDFLASSIATLAPYSRSKLSIVRFELMARSRQ